MSSGSIAIVLGTILFAPVGPVEQSTGSAHHSGAMPGVSTLNAKLSRYLSDRAAEFDQIDPERRALLEQLSSTIRAQLDTGEDVRLLFVCTHNSRRSQMAQLWTAAAAQVYGLKVATYSGGTESTAFNPRAVAAMERAGFDIEKTTDDANPIYHVRMGEGLPVATCFSKRLDGAPNPAEGFVAVMVCSQADRACPAVRGAASRLAIPFVDPKESDNTPQEEAAYSARCAQISREMLYAMSRVNPNATSMP